MSTRDEAYGRASMGTIRKQKNLEAIERLKPNLTTDQGRSGHNASSISLAENSVDSVKGYDINRKMWKDGDQGSQKRKCGDNKQGILKGQKIVNSRDFGAIDLSVIESIPLDQEIQVHSGSKE